MGTTNERENERVNERKSERTGERANEGKNAQTDGCTNERTMIMNEAKLSTYRLTPDRISTTG